MDRGIVGKNPCWLKGIADPFICNKRNFPTNFQTELNKTTKYIGNTYIPSFDHNALTTNCFFESLDSIGVGNACRV